jgi:hypothetical protein
MLLVMGLVRYSKIEAAVQLTVARWQFAVSRTSFTLESHKARYAIIVLCFSK